MERYFDAFLYFTNWGTRILKLRLSTRVLDPKLAGTYLKSLARHSGQSRPFLRMPLLHE